MNERELLYYIKGVIESIPYAQRHRESDLIMNALNEYFNKEKDYQQLLNEKTNAKI